MQRLQAPPFLHEAARQKIEELRMGRRFAQFPEIARRGHNATTEVILPHPVHDDPAGEGIVGPGDPLGQSCPSPRGASLRFELRLFTSQDLEEPRFDRLLSLAGFHRHGWRF